MQSVAEQQTDICSIFASVNKKSWGENSITGETVYPNTRVAFKKEGFPRIGRLENCDTDNLGTNARGGLSVYWQVNLTNIGPNSNKKPNST